MTRLQRVIGTVLALATFVGAPHIADATPVALYQYDLVNYLPSSQGWTGPTLSGTVTATNNTTDNSVEIEDADGIIGPLTVHSVAPGDYSGLWTATAVVRVDESNSAVSYLFGVSTATNYWHLWLDATTGTLKSYNSNGDVIDTLYNVANMSTQFHKYQLVGIGDNSPELWVDGVETNVFVSGYTGFAGLNQIRFGADWSGGTTGIANVRTLRFDTGAFEVPEPASLGLLSLGGLLLLRKRR